MKLLGDLCSRAYRRVRDEYFPPRHPFDQRSGTDTSGRISLRRLGIHSPSIKHGTIYQGVEPRTFLDALAEIPEDFSAYSFVDLGAGKGRALIMAHQLRFRRLIGVEFSARLAETARANLSKLNVKNAEIIVQDAAEFSFPEDPSVVFMFNAFGPEILKSVLLHLRSHPGPLYLAYVNALHDSTIQHDNTLLPLVTREAGKSHTIWYRGSRNPVRSTTNSE